ncbi:MAG TPA: PAS domain S-box protein [Pyrinomonadaceae bacterium]|jgi:anti-anti-sigma factor|nr:PAS domain S-box protein [Pyrinomonadaceae bacterium]
MNNDNANLTADELTESGLNFQILVQNLKDYALYMLDPEGHVISWNEGAQNLKGFTAEEIIGKHISVFFTKEDVEDKKPQRELEIAATTGRFEDEAWRVRKDGSRFWANVVINAMRDQNNKLLGFAKITRDMTERRRTEETLARQAREILEISTPVVQVWEGILLVPLIGTLDSQRTQQVMEKLLTHIADSNSPMALIDITGVPTIDTQTARHLVETVSAVRLLGAEVFLTGVRPAIAQTLVHLGIELSGVVTRSSLSSGLKQALEVLSQQHGAKNGLGRHTGMAQLSV